MENNFGACFEKYLEGVRAKVAENHKQYTNLTAPEVLFKAGSRYVKVYKEEKRNDGSYISKSVHSFIDRTNGDVLKAETWKAPAKHARGNIYDADFGLTRVSAYGPEYLRG
jgi:hypothetical protein